MSEQTKLYANPILNEREKTHGDFEVTAAIAISLKDIMRTHMPVGLPYGMYESMDQICTKMARIASGDPYDPEHWRDMAGYSDLVYERLVKKSPTPPKPKLVDEGTSAQPKKGK